jgi:NTP pyrophosphatase (non-canonical NTP hydrolase)
MTADEYQKQALRTEHTPDFINPAYIEERRAKGINDGVDAKMMARLIHGLLGMCTETGEAQDMAKKGIIYGRPIDLVNILEEAGDKLWYIAVALDAAGFTMQEAMERNIAKLRKRFPEKFTEEQANVRDLNAERKALEG